jgi:hypothetical protein
MQNLLHVIGKVPLNPLLSVTHRSTVRQRKFSRSSPEYSAVMSSQRKDRRYMNVPPPIMIRHPRSKLIRRLISRSIERLASSLIRQNCRSMWRRSQARIPMSNLAWLAVKRWQLVLSRQAGCSPKPSQTHRPQRWRPASAGLSWSS